MNAESPDIRWDFLRTASHELRTPLTSATGYLDLLAEVVGPDDVLAQHYVAMARLGMNRLCERVAELSLAFETSPELQLRLVSIPQLVRDAVDRVAELAEGKSIAVASAEAAPLSVDAYADADAERLGQAFDQVLTNAVRYSPAGSDVKISYNVSPTHIVIVVSDNGPGIPRAERNRVFEPFYRLQAARDAAVQGMGLGLTIAQNIVAAHGGSVVVADGEGPGTRVLLTIPSHR